ncbi:MAG: hypothetical protein KME31_38115 [Tolypothrix carrinoi HA7290-LM1]|nr:hypothetical protein [Tolypothrix carrinoi HA7290-LM1]
MGYIQTPLVAIARAREKMKEAIVVAQNHLTAIENQLETATDKLNELRAEENRFRAQYLIIYPILVTAALFGLVILTAIFSQSTLWLFLQKIWGNLVHYLLGTAVTILTYLGIVWLKYSTDIRDTPGGSGYRHRDANLNPTSQRELTLWVAAKDKEEIFGYYSRSYRTLTALVVEDEQRLCVLTRSLGFPAYFLSQIEFYRDCYERSQSEQIEQEEIPDLIPEEIGSSKELKLAYQSLLSAIALKLISQNSQGNYQFNGQSLGKDREQIALALATEFTFQELYEELKERIEAFEHDFIYHKLQEFKASASYLTRYECKLLDDLLSDYNPLN